jgi:hypothetical protein
MVGGSQRNAVIHATSSAEFLKISPRHEAAETVANQIDPAAAHMPPQVVSQGDGSPFDSFARAVVEGQNLAKPAPAEVARHGQQCGSIREISVNQDDGSL